MAKQQLKMTSIGDLLFIISCFVRLQWSVGVCVVGVGQQRASKRMRARAS